MTMRIRGCFLSIYSIKYGNIDIKFSPRASRSRSIKVDVVVAVLVVTYS